jgi:hypothetical protein
MFIAERKVSRNVPWRQRRRNAAQISKERGGAPVTLASLRK